MSMTDNIKEAIEAQERFCEEHDVPRFAPYDGNCFRCGRNIYDTRSEYSFNGDKVEYGISVKEASTEHITGCTYCYRSFCD